MFYVFTPLLIAAINKIIDEKIFPDSAKTASVFLLEKGKPNENEMSNFWSVSVLIKLSILIKKSLKTISCIYRVAFFTFDICIKD